MNNRHRQVAKAQRLLLRKSSLFDQFISGTNFEAFREAVERVAQAFRDIWPAVTDAINEAAAELRNTIGLKNIGAVLNQLRELEAESNAES